MKAAGFADFDEAAVYRLIWERIIQPEFLAGKLTLNKDIYICEYRYDVNEDIGICAAVLFIGTEYREVQYYYPYFNSDKLSSQSSCVVDRYTHTETYAGVLDESRPGIALIFFINNPLDFRALSLKGSLDADTEFYGVCLSAFANTGMVILPAEGSVHPNESDLEFPDEQYIMEQSREALWDAALDGDEEALETLTESDLINFRKLSDRIETEDLYSVVDQSFMPSGVECDQYSIIGEIRTVKEAENSFTGQALWLLEISCNGINFDLCMRKQDLLGEPAPERRIKCRLWMQGRLNPSR